ncbi:box C/D snoRNA protein 1 isoform X1 [Xyrauchen texanus]|uniref:box C/D snoRNA protein 1 isoform X1 n=1 Tax=Xyrauchen texanus TaxID=154827 RepID=UPI0022427EEF|nr:box C/D snoRNA protein 1 isoform X1 [Xyrauchen texanus]
MAKLILNMLPVMDIDDKSGDEPRGVKRKIALSSCEICGSEEAKYRCPNCMKHTCSLACVKQHKMLSGCRGVREKAAFVPIAQFNEINMLNDYRFLEDTDRLRQRSNRDALLHASRQHPKEGKWMMRKARAAKVTLKFLPKMFSKHRENRTIFRKADGRLHWHLKIHFPQSNAVYSERFPDNTQLIQILSGFIHPSASDPIKRQKLKVYVHAPQEDIRVFMKSEETQPNSLRYLELAPKKSLGENLMYKTVVEYPELFVVLKQHSQEYLTRTLERSNTAQGVADISRTSATKADPHPETLARVAKRSKIISDDVEFEDGEIRSEEEEEEDGSDKEHNGVNGDLKKTDKDDEDHNSNAEDDRNEEERRGNQSHHDGLEMKPKDPLPQDCVEDAEQDGRCSKPQ